MNKKYMPIVIVVLVVIALVGGTSAVIAHNHQVGTHNAMMRADAMKKTDAANAMKKQEAEAAMKKAEAAKAANQTQAQIPAAGDSMMHETTGTTTVTGQ